MGEKLLSLSEIARLTPPHIREVLFYNWEVLQANRYLLQHTDFYVLPAPPAAQEPRP
jgi:hypothetical protein